MVVVGLSLLGPAIGNTFSNVVSALDLTHVENAPLISGIAITN